MFWLLGSLGLARWDLVLAITAVVVLITFAGLLVSGRRLDALAAGDETALTLGVLPDRTRVALLVVVALCTGVVVAAAGAIGFVGLVIPHLARRLVGAVHSRMLPVTALLGALFLIWAASATDAVKFDDMGGWVWTMLAIAGSLIVILTVSAPRAQQPAAAVAG